MQFPEHSFIVVTFLSVWRLPRRLPGTCNPIPEDGLIKQIRLISLYWLTEGNCTLACIWWFMQPRFSILVSKASHWETGVGEWSPWGMTNNSLNYPYLLLDSCIKTECKFSEKLSKNIHCWKSELKPGNAGNTPQVRQKPWGETVFGPSSKLGQVTK